MRNCPVSVVIVLACLWSAGTALAQSPAHPAAPPAAKPARRPVPKVVGAGDSVDRLVRYLKGKGLAARNVKTERYANGSLKSIEFDAGGADALAGRRKLVAPVR